MPHMLGYILTYKGTYIKLGQRGYLSTLGVVSVLVGGSFGVRELRHGTNLRLHLLVGVCPPADKTPLVMEEGTLKGLVKNGFSFIYF